MNEKLLQAIAQVLAKAIHAVPGCNGFALDLRSDGRLELALRAVTDGRARDLALAVGIVLEDRTTPAGRYLVGGGQLGKLHVTVEGPYHFELRTPLDEPRFDDVLAEVAETVDDLAAAELADPTRIDQQT